MVEAKVKTSSYAAAVTTVAMYLLAQIPAVAGMPEPVKAALGAVILAAATFGVGYATDHTFRPDLKHTPKHAAPDESGHIGAVEAVVIAFFGLLILILLLRFL